MGNIGLQGVHLDVIWFAHFEKSPKMGKITKGFKKSQTI